MAWIRGVYTFIILVYSLTAVDLMSETTMLMDFFFFFW